MRTKPWWAISVAVTASVTQSVSATVVWSYDGGSPSSAFPITVNVSGGDKILRIYSTTGAEAIGEAQISGTIASGSSLCIIVASPTTSCSGNNSVSGGSTFGGLSFAAGSESLRDASRLRLNVSGSITGSITVGRITELKPGGNIAAEAQITATAADNGSTRAIQSISPDGSIFGGINAMQGSIGELRCETGAIGDLATSIQPEISAANIGTLQAQSINAAITSLGDISLVNSTSGGIHGSIDAAGRLWDGTGSHTNTVLYAGGASSAQVHVGSVDGNIVLLGGLTGSPNQSGLEIDGDLNGNLTSSNLLDSLVVHGDICGTCTGEKVVLGSALGFGTLAVDGDIGNSDPDFEGVDILATDIDTLSCQDFYGHLTALDQFADPPAVLNLHIRGSVRYGPTIGFPTGLSMRTGAGFPEWRIDGALEQGTSLTFYSTNWTAKGYIGVFDGLLQILDDGGFGSNFVVDEWASHGLAKIGPYWDASTPPAGSAFLIAQNYNDVLSGAIGVPPFTVNAGASNFYNYESDATTPKVLWSEWSDQYSCHNADQDIVVEFYGPVRRNANVLSGAPLLKVEFLTSVETANGQVIASTDMTQFCDFEISTYYPAVSKRQVRISPKPGYILPWGTYSVRPFTEALDNRTPPLVCADLLVNGEVPVAEFEYVFEIGRDCGEFPDCTFDADCPGMLFPVELCDGIDFNNDDLFPDTQDISDFIAVFGGAACPTSFCNDIDFNNDGLFPDAELDIGSLLSVFGGGPCLW